MKTDIELEDEVKDKYTGMKGTALSRTEFVNGCIQFGIVQKYDSKQPLVDNVAEVNIDSQSLIITKKGPRHKKSVEEKSTGGPSRVMRRRM